MAFTSPKPKAQSPKPVVVIVVVLLLIIAGFFGDDIHGVIGKNIFTLTLKNQLIHELETASVLVMADIILSYLSTS